jgi:hypothetical protein
MELAKDISNSDDIIDSRDITARIAELTALTEPDEYDTEELTKLKALAEEAGEDSRSWADGITLIRDTYFEDYAQELAEDIGAIDPKAGGWPLNCIDWGRAAEELKVDYQCVSFDGEDYWMGS